MVEWDHGFTSSSPEYQQTVLNDEFEQLRSEKILETDKSPEEIQKLSVDEGLSVMDRASLLVSSSHDIQKLCVINQLPTLLKTDQMDTLCKVIPKLCTFLPGAGNQFQKPASKVFADILEQELLSVHIYITACLPTVIKLLESRDLVTSNLWLDTMVHIMPHLPKEVIKRQILGIAEANGQLSMSVSSRQATCKLLGAMAGKFDSYWVKKELYPLAKSLCLDVDCDVRAVMCQQLNQLIKALGFDIAKSTLFPHLIELVSDEELSVQSAAIEALLDLMSFLDKATLTNEVVPLLKRYCEKTLASMKPDSVIILSKMLGRICHVLKGYLTTEQQQWYLGVYRKLSKYTCPVKKLVSVTPTQAPPIFTISLTPADDEIEPECIRWCAYNLPAMVLFCEKSSFDKELLHVVQDLGGSPSVSVRRTLASGFHEVVKVVNKSSRLKLAPVYQNLLKDDSGEVLHALVGHLSESLSAFAAASNLSPETWQPGLLDFISPLQSCEQLASTYRQWRLHHELLASMECLVTCITSDQLYNKFVPILFKYISGPCVLPVKLAACKTLCVFIRNIRKQELRHELCARLSEDCAQHSSYKQRVLYINICGFVLDIFSRVFFKEHFYQQLLELANDPIVNVRLHLCRLLPSLKSTIKLPGDRVLLQKLEQTVRKLISQERDPDVSQAIRDVVIEMDRIEVAMETLTRRTYFEADLIDQKREEEERALLLWEAKECEKISKKMLGKSGKSPSESRKGSSSSLLTFTTTGNASPSTTTKSSNKSSRNSSLASSPKVSVCKSLSVPSPPASNSDQLSSTSSTSTTKKVASPSPHASPSVGRKNKGPPKGSQTLLAATSSKISGAKSKDSVTTKSTKPKKSHYGLEYSKTKKK